MFEGGIDTRSGRRSRLFPKKESPVQWPEGYRFVCIQAGTSMNGIQQKDGGVVPDSRLTDIAAELRHETARAFLVWDGDQEVWLPKSQVERNADGTFTLPEWLAKEKGLI